MARTQRLIRLGTALAFICLLFANGNAKAENTNGVSVTVWNNRGFNASPPIPPTTAITGEYITDDVQDNFDAQPVFNLYEDFIVRYQGFITAPVTANVRFYAPADDGVQMFLSEQRIINDWRDKGGGGSFSAPVQMVADVSQPFTLWFYENGGGAWVNLQWDIDGYWQTIPASAFTISAIATTTTTQEPATTTTEAPTTTTSEIPTTTNLQGTSPPMVVQTSVPVEVPQTTDTTATTVAAVVPQPTQPVTTLGSSVPVATVPATSSTDAPAVTLPMPTTTLPIQEPTLEPPPENQTETETQILELIDNLDESTPEEIIEAVDTFIEAGITSDTALALATSGELLETITAEQASEIFDALDITTLDASQAAELVEAVQDAPVAVRESFEEQVNIFDGVVDSYVPIGSTVPISTRRLVIAAGALLSAVPVSSGRRN
jgi:hypothetical protein